MDETPRKTPLAELSDEEYWALFYALAVTEPEHERTGPKSFTRFWTVSMELTKQHAPSQGYTPLTDFQRRQLLQRGIDGLAARGIIRVKRNGEGTNEPVYVDKDSFDISKVMQKVILHEGN